MLPALSFDIGRGFTTILTILITILMFGLMIFIHELGHFLTAKWNHVYVHEFSIGMGPRIWGFGKGETKYSLRLFPIGGYVKMEGEDEKSNDPRAFCNRPVWARMMIAVAGAFMNVLLGFLCFTIWVGALQSSPGVPIVAEVTAGWPAEEAGLLPGDRVTKIGQSRILSTSDANYALILYEGNDEPVEVTYKRNGKKVTIPIVPRMSEDGRYLFGMRWTQVEKTPLTVLREGLYETRTSVCLVFTSLKGLLSGAVPLSDVSSVIGVGQVVGDTVSTLPETRSFGLLHLLFLLGFISVNLGVMNLLPIPALDGSRVVFLLIEAVRRKPVPPDKEGMIHAAGFLLLIGVMILAFFNDIMRLL